MPIMIDTSSDNLNEQIAQVNNTIALNKQVEAKYFSSTMTGNGKNKKGFFSADNDTINAFLKERRRLLEDVDLNEAANKSYAHHNGQTFGNHFHKSTKEKDEKFRKFENNLTSMIPPIILFPILSSRTPAALSFPKNIGMYNLNALETIWTKATSGTIDGKPATTYIRPVIQSMSLYSRETQDQSKSGGASKRSQVSGQPDIYVMFATVLDGMDNDGDMIFANTDVGGGRLVTESQGVVSIALLTENSRTEYDYDKLNGRLYVHLNTVIANKQVNIQGISDHQLSLTVGDQSMSDILKSQATTITHQAGDTLLTFVEVFGDRVRELKAKRVKYPSIQKSLDNALITFVQHIDLLNDIEDDLITTDLLASIYQKLKDNLKDQHTIDDIARHSLRLLLSQRLHELEEIRDSKGLYQFTPSNHAIDQAMRHNPNYSTQQKSIITTTDPLVIGQAGAGSGKSHTLIGRINYLKDHGEDLSKVLVLSFTNVAAININNRFPGVRSETLANMFHTIYSATYPVQHLSQPSTVANSIRLLNPASQYFQDLGIDADELGSFIAGFAARLEQFDQTGFKRVNLQQELKRLSNLIEGNLDMCIHVLNAVEQTTLELEPIIIHHKLLHGGDDLNIPDEYQNLNYIITDESQDISTFEYILLLELTLHYRSQLLIIGDGSQTLYEFRNSDPRYMNALESSNVFTSHKLETNYRSKEEILMYANQFLQVIDANKYAGIQLKSSNFNSPTEQSVKNAITIGDNEISGGKTKDYTEGLKEYLQEDEEFQKWFIKRVNKGEQVAIMGWTRKEVTEAGEVIEELLKNNNLAHIEITNIMSNNERPMTLLSRFARAKAPELRAFDPTHQHYLKDMERLINMFLETEFKRASSKQNAFYYNFIFRSVKSVIQTHEWQAWLADYRQGKINMYQIGSFLIQQLLRMETRKNAMDQFLRKQKEVPNYDECPIILSTIHGTKGLEFDHTVVLFNEAKRGSTSQESMRMMFVALSRAKKSEFIVNSYGATKKRTVSDSHAGMFQTPVNSAYLRTLNDVAKANQTQLASTTP
ncbi:ATP-dependent helicase [Salipaludibacillus agaradhaerens]|jgi:superfamily I DNA/RNA helicase|uniref:UvrD-helicase domain-containing protein n=1 Tax=Salipaludibacillus agaradhaerens TaxID=76935 RepID=UPI0021516464|nr:ATP-dependent helicase [Salipaludibacillus agaradhaerens]MCR6108562.1 ATP-dependent helicase [Salipaludibacillus agaradhaerens]MCR6120591.1 ATP-dependent helicase [Salipaludibacillus agaradhaerens]